MYLVRKLKKTGEVQVYAIDGRELAPRLKFKPGELPVKIPLLRQRAPKAWHFNKGVAAVDYTVDAAMYALHKEEARETLGS